MIKYKKKDAPQILNLPVQKMKHSFCRPLHVMIDLQNTLDHIRLEREVISCQGKQRKCNLSIMWPVAIKSKKLREL
jgi:hypothetical protein